MKFKEDNQEIYGWIGNTIFVSAQIIQIYHTHKIKETRDISYWLIILLFIGNAMYISFGYIDDSLSLFAGSVASCVTIIILFLQKVYYDNYYNRYPLLGNQAVSSNRGFTEYNSILND